MNYALIWYLPNARASVDINVGWVYSDMISLNLYYCPELLKQPIIILMEDLLKTLFVCAPTPILLPPLHNHVMHGTLTFSVKCDAIVMQ